MLEENREENNRKRIKSVNPFVGPLNRVPLTETSGNIPSPVHRKTKVSRFNVPSHKTVFQTKPNFSTETSENHSKHRSQRPASNNSKQPSRLEGGDLLEWQRSWRPILKKSVVYFDTQGIDSLNVVHQTELKKAQRALKHVGCTLTSFYDRDVTIIISRRQFDANKEYSSTDIFQDASLRKIRVWGYEKVFRFMENLGVVESNYDQSKEKSSRSNDLRNLLREEKIFGTSDRDPNAKRDDLIYLEHNFLYVYDLSQNVRPIAVREWTDDSMPRICLTLDGKCPFIPETNDVSDRKRQRRKQKFDATESYRHLLNKASCKIVQDIVQGKDTYSSFLEMDTSLQSMEDSVAAEKVVKNKDAINQKEIDNEETYVESSSASSKIIREEPIEVSGNIEVKMPPPAFLARESSSIFQLNNSNSKFYDVAASGYNGASNAASFSVDSGLNSAATQGNGLGPTVSQVPSRNISNLKRRIFMKRQKQQIQSTDDDKEKESKPGYCENCRVKYNNFDDHIKSKRHRTFACDDSNFKEIDSLISVLHEGSTLG